MSTVLAMVLATGMAVPASGPGMASGETEQGLDLSGEWEGVCLRGGALRHARLTTDPKWGVEACYSLEGGFGAIFRLGDVKDEGGGRLTICNGRNLLGIHRWQGGYLFICFCDAEGDRPSSFHGSDGQHLLILRRVKPRK